MIDTSPAETLEDAAVKLRRLGAYVEGVSRRGFWRGLWGLWRGRRWRLASYLHARPNDSSARYLAV